MAADNSKVYRSSTAAKAGLWVTDTKAALVGDEKNFIIADNQGLWLKGSQSWIGLSHNIRVAGFWTLLPDALRMMPSTIVSPLPVQRPDPPTTAIARLAEDSAYFMAIMGFLGL